MARRTPGLNLISGCPARFAREGGKARAKKLSQTQRRERSRQAALARWERYRKAKGD